MASNIPAVKWKLRREIHIPADVGLKFWPEDSDMCEYLNRKVESRSLPPWKVHELVDFYNYSPQQLTQRYRAERDRKWYFISLASSDLIKGKTHLLGWRPTHEHSMEEKKVHDKRNGQLVGYKEKFEFLDDNLHKTGWLMQVYFYVEDANPSTNKMRKGVFVRIYKEEDEEEKRVLDDEADEEDDDDEIDEEEDKFSEEGDPSTDEEDEGDEIDEEEDEFSEEGDPSTDEEDGHEEKRVPTFAEEDDQEPLPKIRKRM